MKVQKISIGVVTYNSENEIINFLNSLDSVLDGVNPEVAVYVLDNGSSDGTIRVLNEFHARHFDLDLIIPNANLGFGGGHNAISDSASADIYIISNPDITFMNSDIFVNIIKYFEMNDALALYSPAIKNSLGEIQFLNKKNPTVLDMAIRFMPSNWFVKRKKEFVKFSTGYESPQPIEFASGAFMAVRLEYFRKVGGFDRRFFMYFEDADLSRMLAKKFETIYDPTVAVEHQWQRASHKNVKYFLIHVQSLFKYFSKWGWVIK